MLDTNVYNRGPQLLWSIWNRAVQVAAQYTCAYAQLILLEWWTGMHSYVHTDQLMQVELGTHACACQPAACTS